MCSVSAKRGFQTTFTLFCLQKSICIENKTTRKTFFVNKSEAVGDNSPALSLKLETWYTEGKLCVFVQDGPCEDLRVQNKNSDHECVCHRHHQSSGRNHFLKHSAAKQSKKLQWVRGDARIHLLIPGWGSDRYRRDEMTLLSQINW